MTELQASEGEQMTFLVTPQKLRCALCAQDGAGVVSVSFLCPGLQLLLSSVVLLSTWCGPIEYLVASS